MSSCSEKGKFRAICKLTIPLKLATGGLQRHERRGSICAVSERSHPPLDICALNSMRYSDCVCRRWERLVRANGKSENE